MKIFISESDRQSARRIALKNIARFFNIKNWETKTNEELHNELNSLKDKSAIQIICLLKEYFTAYDKWFEFYQKQKMIEEQKGEEINLNNVEQKELNDLINKREDTLNALQEEFEELQLSDYNRKTFGNDILGTLKK